MFDQATKHEGVGEIREQKKAQLARAGCHEDKAELG